jgi:hypothetical protein
MKTQRAIRLCGMVGLVAMAAACASSTAFRSTWQNPEGKPLALEGKKVVALVISTQETVRRSAEDSIAAQMTARGAQGVAAWTVLATADVRNEEAARAAIAKTGATAVVTMEVVAETRDWNASTFSVSMRYSSATHRSFWPHYRFAWNSAWAPPPPPRTNVWIETLVYSLEPDQLLWAGRSRTVNPNNISALFTEVASRAGRELERAGLLKATAQ